MDWYLYESPKTRVSDWADILVIVCSSARVGEYIESSCRAGSGRGLHYKVRVPLGFPCLLLLFTAVPSDRLTRNRISPSECFETNMGT